MGSLGSASESEARRRLAVTRVNQGWKREDVGVFLDVTTRAAGKSKAAYRASGDDGLASKPNPGAQPKLSPRQEPSLLSWLARSPRAFGDKTELWTARRLAEVIQKRYGDRFNSNYMADWLRRRNHSPQMPATKAVERNNLAIPRWAAQDWPRIQKKARDEGSHIVLIDESGFFLNPLVRRPWAPNGPAPVLTCLGCHRDKVSTIASTTIAPHRRRVGLHWNTDADRYIDASGVMAFLRGLLKHLRGKVTESSTNNGTAATAGAGFRRAR